MKSEIHLTKRKEAHISKIKGLEKELDPIMIGTSSALFTDETTPWIPTNLTNDEQFAVVDDIPVPDKHAQTLTASKMKLTAEEVKWLNLE